MRTRSRDIVRLGLLSAMLPGAAIGAEAELCVTCVGPQAAYRCLVELPATSKTVDARAQMLCATELATAGGHQSCSVARVSTAPCEGPLRAIKAPGLPAPTPREALAQPDAASVPAGTAPAGAREAPPEADSPARPPAAAAPGALVQRAAKGTWQCVASFFKDC